MAEKVKREDRLTIIQARKKVESQLLIFAKMMMKRHWVVNDITLLKILSNVFSLKFAKLIS